MKKFENALLIDLNKKIEDLENDFNNNYYSIFKKNLTLKKLKIMNLLLLY